VIGLRFRILPGWGGALAALVCAVATPGAALANDGLFGSSETARPSIAMFPKWTDVVSRTAGEGLDRSDCVGPALNCRSHAEWRQFVERMRRLDRARQLIEVNAEMNRRPYITDPENWGLPDYWATLLEFMGKDGDCEDYAIAKYVTLRALGWSTQDMRIVVVQDENLNTPHAILSVRVGAQVLILDNQIQQVMPDRSIVHYRPIYSINERAWWLHRAG
jgi:predicted transglutaminase-like cysteine proteinase